MTSTYKDKRVVFFVAETIPAYIGCGRHAFSFAKTLCRQGAKCSIISYNYNNKLIANEVIDGVHIKRTRYFNKNLFLKVVSVPNLLKSYFSKTLSHDIIIIYGRYLIAYPFIIFIARLFNKKIIFRSTLLGRDDISSIKKRSKLIWPFIKFLFNKIDCYWSINQEFKNIWDQFLSPHKSVTIPQGVDQHTFYSHSRNLPLKSEKLKILSCGILIKRKGYAEIFEVLSKLKIPFSYTIVGQFETNEWHRSSAEEKADMKELYLLGKRLLGSKIVFAGNTSNILKYYHSADVLLHGANTEGTPNVVLEAMSSGLPVICRKLDGLSGSLFVNNENCIEYSDKNELQAKILGVYNNTHILKGISRKAEETISSQCTLEIAAKELSKCL